ncbi:MAG: tetratricopeptide repeat protein [bacterium]
MNGYTVTILAASIAFILGIALGHYLLRSAKASDSHYNQEPEKGAYIKGLKYIISNEPDKAIAEFTKAVKINTNTVEIYINLGNLFREKGEIERAIRIHQSILLRPNLKPDIKESALMDLGLDFSAAGFFDRAIATFQQLISLHPKNMLAHRELVKLYEEEKDWQNAFDEASLVQKLTRTDMSPLLAHIVTELGKEISAKGDTGQAKKELKRAIGLNKRCTEAYLVLGDIYFAEEKLGQAISTWEEIIHNDLPFSRMVYERLEKGYLKRGNYDHIETIYREVIGKRPEDYDTRLILADYYQKKGSSKKAIQELKEGLRFSLGQSSIRQKLGEILLKENMEREAIAEYRGIIEEMGEQKSLFRCSKCGYKTAEIIWKCPQCKEWDTFVTEDS